MTTTLAIIGGGPGLGLALARRFGAEGHAVALISRSRKKLDTLVAELPGVTTRGFGANVQDPKALAAALEQAAAELGPIHAGGLRRRERVRPDAARHTGGRAHRRPAADRPGAIRPDHPTHSPTALADRLWRLHSAPGPFREVVEAGPADGGGASPMQQMLGDLTPPSSRSPTTSCSDKSGPGPSSPAATAPWPTITSLGATPWTTEPDTSPAGSAAVSSATSNSRHCSTPLTRPDPPTRVGSTDARGDPCSAGTDPCAGSGDGPVIGPASPQFGAQE